MGSGLDTGDLEFLKGKTLVHEHGEDAGTGEICSYVVPSGKTFYLVEASIFVETNGDSSHVVTLKNDTTVVEELGGAILATSGGLGGIMKYKSSVQVDSLVGDGAKKYSLNNETNSGSETVHGVIFGWTENT